MLSQEISICLLVEGEEDHFTVTLEDISRQRSFTLDMNFHIWHNEMMLIRKGLCFIKGHFFKKGFSF